MASGEGERGPEPKGYRKVVTDDGRVIYVPSRLEDFLAASRSVVSIRRGRQHPVQYSGEFFLGSASIVFGPKRIRIISNDMNVERLPDGTTFFLDISPVLTMGVANPGLPDRVWERTKPKRRRR